MLRIIHAIEVFLRLSLRMYWTQLFNISKFQQTLLEKKMLTDDGRKPIAIGHRSDSGDPKFFFFLPVRIYLE